ncbi:MAG: tetraacyldisaccharide 4'-kinase [Thermodesulfobacteriota bacterium]|jgi:tetraacyldisaccharide 4'-kinase
MMRRIDQFLYRKEKSLWERVSLFPLYLLSLPYGGAVRARSFLYSLQLLKKRELPCPVISVGNITVGGTGKTPLVMALAKGLMARGISVAILSRGYKRTKTSEPVVSDGKTIFLSPEESGDEPFLMAKACQGIPVLVGKDRFINGQLALQRFGVRGLLLDDGYQYLPLYRDINILLVDSTIGFGDYHLLPRGILREPLSHLRRANLFLINKAAEPAAYQSLEKKIQEIYPGAQVFHSDYLPVSLVGPEEEQEGLDSLKGKKVLALSGVANPNSFSSMLRKCGMKIVEEVIFPDHHVYTTRDISFIQEKAEGVDGIVTTEKDMVKLKKLDIGHPPIWALRIEMKIWEEEEFLKRIVSLF